MDAAKKTVTAIVGILLVGAVATSCVQVEQLAEKGRKLPKEFVCEDDTTLTERHVGVETAHLTTYNTTWYIRYVTGQVAYYNQPTGETCRLIEVENDVRN